MGTNYRLAVETNPRSASARIALSYAQQAGFDLKGARASVEDACGWHPVSVEVM